MELPSDSGTPEGDTESNPMTAASRPPGLLATWRAFVRWTTHGIAAEWHKQDTIGKQIERIWK